MPRFYYDTILHNAGALQYLKGLVGVGRIVLGSDEPFPIGDSDPLGSLRAAGFSADEIDRIAERNPRELYKTI